MSEFNIEVECGSSVRLPTAGKYCDRDIVVKAVGGDDGSYKSVIERTATNPTLPSDLTVIGNSVFRNCTSLTSISVPEGVTSIEAFAFQNCTNLALISLPEGITIMGNGVFAGCTNLVLTSLPECIATIGNQAFQDCTGLALTYLPKGISFIGTLAFGNCTGLTELTFKGTPTGSIRSDAFSGCTNLIVINVPWAEGEVANAPWGATNATINYNYTEE